MSAIVKTCLSIGVGVNSMKYLRFQEPLYNKYCVCSPFFLCARIKIIEHLSSLNGRGAVVAAAGLEENCANLDAT
jgi:hypothetical protein